MKYGIKVSEAAKILGIGENSLRLGLRANKYPFGTCYKNGGEDYFYYIHQPLFDKFLNGELGFGGFVYEDNDKI